MRFAAALTPPIRVRAAAWLAHMCSCNANGTARVHATQTGRMLDVQVAYGRRSLLRSCVTQQLITAQVQTCNEFARSAAATLVAASAWHCYAISACSPRHATVGTWSTIFPRRVLVRALRVHMSNAHNGSNGPICCVRRAGRPYQAQY